MSPMKKSSFFMAKIEFSQEVKNPILSAYLIHPEDWYGFMIPYFGKLKPFKIPLTELGTFTGIQIQRRKYFHVQDTFYLPSSMTKCKNYDAGEDSYMKCLVKCQVDYFESLANTTYSNCGCIPNTYKSYFEIQPTSLEWKDCKYNYEHVICTGLMDRFLSAICKFRSF